ncbi:MAG: ABC transporter permease [Parvularculaceae bacterium]
MWRAFALEDLRQQYGRTFFGIGWIAISFAILVAIKGVFFSVFSARPMGEFTLYVALGFLVYQFIVGNLNAGCNLFTQNAAWMKSGPIPYSVFVFQGAAKQCILFAGNATVVIAALAALRPEVTWSAAMALPALIIYFATALWLQLLFGLISARIRDFAQLVASATRMLFFITPIIWTYDEAVGIRQAIAFYNPLTHYIEILRAAVLSGDISATSWAIVGGITVTGLIAAFSAFALLRHRIPYWI